MKNLKQIIFLFLLVVGFASAQVGIGTMTPNASSILDLVSTDRGFLMPRLTTVQRNNIASPTDGLIVYNTDQKSFNYYDGPDTTWRILTSDTSLSNTSTYTVNCNATVGGTYETGRELDGGNTITFNVDVSVLGSYGVSFNVNGMTFAGTGNFTALGVQPLVLTGAGFPAVSGTTTGSVNFPGNQVCRVIIPVKNGLADINPCPTQSDLVGGKLVVGVPADENVLKPLSVPYVTTGGVLYNIASTATNGISILEPLSGEFSSGVSPESISLNFSGTPLAAGTTTFTYDINERTGCTFTVPINSSASGAISATTCVGVLSGTYQAQLVMNPATNTKIISVTVATAGTFTITTNTVNGVTFSSGPVVLAAGVQGVTLRATGTPQNAGTFNYSYSVENTTATPPTFASCSFAVTYALPSGLPNYQSLNCATPSTNLAFDYLKASNTGANDALGRTIIKNFDASADTSTRSNLDMSSAGTTLVAGTRVEDGSVGGFNGGNDNALTNSGAIYIYERPNLSTAWSAPGILKPNNSYLGASDYFGNSTAISGDGNTIVAGAWAEDGNGGINQDPLHVPNGALNDSGAAYVFIRNGGTWDQQAYLKATTKEITDHFGNAVDISNNGNVIVVGAYRENGTGTGVNPTDNQAGTNQGAAYVFRRTGTVWVQEAYLKNIQVSDTSDAFGQAVTISGDGNTIAVAAYLEDGSGNTINPTHNNGATNSGAVYVYLYNGTTWVSQATIKPSNTSANSLFGTAVSLSQDGNKLLVSSRTEDGNGVGVNPPITATGAADSGSAYLFTRSGSTWSQNTYFKATNPSVGDNFGHDAKISDDGNHIIVGAVLEDSNVVTSTCTNAADNASSSDSGAAYVYSLSGGTWVANARLKADITGAVDRAGESVTINANGTSAAMAAPLEDGSGTGRDPVNNNSAADSGAIYVYTP
jgi:trimeric autotransporter adhesin